MISLLFHTFGFWGTLAVAIAVAAAVGIRRHWRDKDRHAALLRALPMMVLALLLGDCNAVRVADIRLDRSAEIARAQAELDQRKALEAQRAARREGRQPDADDADAAATNVVETAVTETAQDAEPEYRRRGVQQRDPERATVTTEAVPVAFDKAEEPVRIVELPEPLRGRVQRLERWIRRLLQLLMAALCGLVFWDYFRDYTTIQGPWYPLPLGGRWIDNWTPPQARIELPVMDDAAVRALLRHAVRKAEPFVVFAAADPFAGIDALPRIVLGRRVQKWRLPRRVFGRNGFPDDPEFLFDVLWFNRCAVTVVATRPDDAVRVLTELIAWLDRLRQTRAVARRTVNLLWRLPPPPPETIERLERLCRETNWRLLLAPPG